MHIRNKDGNTPVREFIIIKMTKCHFDNYITW